MKMNKKGFTLIELILVIGIIGVILAFAIPNVTTTLEKNKKDQMISDAKDMVEKAKNYCLTKQCFTKDQNKETLELSDIDPKSEIKTSPFGKAYNRNSYISISSSTDDNGIKTYTYSVYLTDEAMCIGKKERPTNISEFNEKNKYDLVVDCSKE